MVNFEIEMPADVLESATSKAMQKVSGFVSRSVQYLFVNEISLNSQGLGYQPHDILMYI